MGENSVFYRDLAYIFIAALLGGLLARKLRQPLILGYIVGGILVGPFTPGPSVQDFRTLELLAEIGVILLMYSIGLEFSFGELLRVRWVAAVGTPIAMLLSIGSGVLAGKLFGWPPQQGIAVGAIVSVASTMVLSRFLVESGELRTLHGRIMIGMVLVEDLMVVVLTIVLPTIGPRSVANLSDIGIALAKAVLVLVPASFLAVKLVPRLMARVARTRSQELYLVVALALGFATATISQAVGLSLAAGAFLAGLIVSSSEYAHETLAHLLPLRDMFAALFFVTVGTLIRPSALIHNMGLVAVIVFLVVAGKFAIRAGIVALFGYPFWTALLVGVGLTQIGEFSFVLVRIARSAGLAGEDVYNATLAASLISILLNAALMRSAPAWIRRGEAQRAFEEADQAAVAIQSQVVICGFGRIGSLLGTALETFGVPYVVVELNPEVIKALRLRGVPCIFGDASHLSILERTHVDRANLVVVTVPDKGPATAVVRNVRGLNPAVPIIARAHQMPDREELLTCGATQVIQPEIEASATLVSNALQYLNLPGANARAYVEVLRAGLEKYPRSSLTPVNFPALQDVMVGDFLGDGETLGEAHVRERFGVTVVDVVTPSGEVVVNPPATTSLRSGDKLRVFGLPKQIAEFAAYVGGVEDRTPRQG
ncbi:MAG: cation:proton antiporter [Acidobacteriia bacterium]|nr:cation:proton antiporter [Terriglobia bacterium]